MAKTKFEEMMDRLPSNIKETDVLRFSTKKVLAALLELLLHSEARESRIIYCQNSRLRKLSGVGSDELLTALQQLMDYDLISRKVGIGIGEASEYRINFQKLKEPIVEKTFDDLFGEFTEECKSSETPISTTITTTIPNTTSNPTSNTLQEQHQEKLDILDNSILKESNHVQLKMDLNQIEDDSQVIPIEEKTTVTDDDQYRQWLQKIEPLLNYVRDADNKVVLNSNMNVLKWACESHYQEHDGISENVAERIKKEIMDVYRTKWNELKNGL